MDHFKYADDYQDEKQVLGAFPSFLRLLAEFEHFVKNYTGKDDSSMIAHIFNTFDEFLENEGEFCASIILDQQVQMQEWVWLFSFYLCDGV